MPENKKARRTIKLRPIGSKKSVSDTADPIKPTTGGPEAPTVKLSPMTPTPSAAPPAAPTVKLSPGGAATPPPAAPTVKLSPGGTPPAAPTVKLSANTPPPATGGDDDRTQPLKRTPQAAATRPGSLIPGLEESFGDKENGVAPSAQTKIAPPTPTPTAPIPSAAPPAAPPVQEEEETVSMSRSELEEDSTQMVNKPMQDDSTSPIQTSLPGAKQTIKLRPSTATQPAAPTESQVGSKPAAASTIKLKPKAPMAGSDGQEQTAAIAKQTIKLVPNKSASKAAPKPGDPTVKLTESKAPAQPKPGDPTVKLTPKAGSEAAPGAKTLVLPTDGGEAAAAAPAMPKTKLSIKKQEPSHESEMQEGQLAPGGAPVAAETESSSDEPSIIFTLVAVFTLIILGFIFAVMAAQYSNHWMGQNINIPVLSDTVK